MEETLQPVPIEDIEYLNYFQYLSHRMKDMLGEAFFTKYTEQQPVAMGLSTLRGEKLTDADIIATINASNVELLKDLVMGSNDLELEISGLYLKLKEPVDKNISEKEAIEYAEDMLISYYTFIKEKLNFTGE